LQTAYRAAAQGRRLDDELVIARQHQLAVGFGSRQQKVPIAGVELHQLFVLDSRALDFRRHVCRPEQRFEDLAVRLIEEARVSPSDRQLHGGVTAFDQQLRRAVIAARRPRRTTTP